MCTVLHYANLLIFWFGTVDQARNKPAPRMRHREMMDGKGIPPPEVPAYMMEDEGEEAYESGDDME